MNLFEKYHIVFRSVDIDFFNRINTCTVTICDEKVLKLYPELQQIKPLFAIRANEKTKSIRTLENIFEFFYQHKVDKSYTVIVIGGGVVCDMGALAASLWFRGIPFVLVPTTLLAMTDAAIGGKTAVNFKKKKNLIGTISLPEVVYIDTRFLSTLPRKEKQQGIAEIIKHALLLDKSLYEKLLHAKEIEEDIIKQSVLCKLNIIDKDLKENGIRRLLNAGHTIGHTLELTHNIKHGIAVAVGLSIETTIFYRMGLTDLSTVKQVYELIERFIDLPSVIDKEKVKQSLWYDKKKHQNTLVIPVIKEIGRAELATIEMNEFVKYLTE